MKRALYSLGILIASFGLCVQGYAGWISNLTGPAEFGGAGLPYHIYIPNSQPTGGNGHALMINLHGCTMSHSIMRDRANWEPIAEEKGMIVVVIDENDEHTNSCFQWWAEAVVDRDGVSQSSRIIQITEMIRDDAQYNIDPNQVYISGLSAGGGMAWQTACLAPDIYAGAGLAAAPMLRVDSSGGFGYIPKLPTYTRQKCDELAGSASDSLDTIIFSLIQGDNDTVVDPRYLEDNTKGIVEGIMSTHGMPGKTYANPDSQDGVIQYDYLNSTLKVWKQGETVRLSSIQVSGMDHRWPSGDGVAAYGGPLNGNYYVDGNYGNYPEYLTNFFFKNNMRLDSHLHLFFKHSKEVSMPEDLFNLTGKYGVTLAGGTFLHGSGTDNRTFPRETIVPTTDTLNIPAGATIKYALLYYGGLIGVKGQYRECDDCPLKPLPTEIRWNQAAGTNYDFKGDYTSDGLDNEDDVRNNKITFNIDGQNFGPYGPETASQPPGQSEIGHVSKIDWENLAKIHQGTLQGTAFTIWSNRIDITGLLKGKTGTVKFSVNPPDKLDVNVNAAGQTGGNIIGSTDVNKCLDSGSWAVVVVYEDPAGENKNIVMKDKLFLRASDYSWHLYGEHGRRHTKINHAPIQQGAKLYLYSMMGHEAGMPVPTSPLCSCGCAGSYYLDNAVGTRIDFYSDIADDVIKDDLVHSDKTNGPWYIHPYNGSGPKAIRGNDYTRVISGGKVAEFPNLYEGKGTANFPARYAGDGKQTIVNEDQWTTGGDAGKDTSNPNSIMEKYGGHDWSGQGLITYHAADNSIALLEMELDSSKITVGQTETWISIKANQKQVLKPMDRIALRFVMFETPLYGWFKNVRASCSEEPQQITVTGNVVKEGGSITELTVTYNGSNITNGSVSFGPYKVTIDGSGNFNTTSQTLDLNYNYVATLTATDNDGESNSVNTNSIDIGQCTPCKQWTSSNSTHKLEGRAKSCWFFYHCAVGSNDFLGVGGTTTTVRQEDPGKDYYQHGTCPERTH
jgi:poly(hydroxyalkanoate) depolymerase family esterase